MKIKFDTAEQIKEFCRLSAKLEGDILLKSGNYVVDGKSIAGIFSLSLDKPVDFELICRSDREVDSFISGIEKIGILVK